ncbi:hypothetical protein LC607_17880 [Nostoc sp. CHAB 5824]|nr:hypothetical protein [Nostoc sp. CHAB 5824]
MTTLDEMLQGIEIIRRYEPNPKITLGRDFETSRGVVFIGDYASCYMQMTDDLREQMKLLNWYGTFDGWTHLVDE